ncbi:MAG: zinc dependent phospholipase C family protein [Calditerrivibrio sp.]|nr:zinc dependent phospholipase C family protein [Calditerrivibrio sp.]
MIITIILLLIPTNLLAWGPETHIKIALDILEHTNFSLIKIHQAFFITGNVFPDLFNFFKDISQFKKSLPTHSWSTVSKLFSNAKTDQDRAFIYGYSAHLAADIISHNQFVPQQTMLVSRSRFLSHFLLELASSSNDKKYRYALIEVLEKANVYGNVFLNTFNIDERYFKKELFLLKNAIKMQNLIKIPEIISYMKRKRDRSFLLKSSIYEEKSLELAKKAVESGFIDLMKYDPSGKQSIKQAKEMRKELLGSFTKKELKNHNKDHIFTSKFDPKKMD